MKVLFPFAALVLALLIWDPSSALAETRMQVAVPSTPVLNQAGGGGQSVGTVASGEILFVSRVEGDWAAISPPERFTLWLNKDFIEGNRVVAKVIQVRSGPGIQHPVVGKLERGAPVMPRGEEGDWCKISPPSSCLLWVRKQDLTEVKTRTTPIREVEPVAEPKKPEPRPQPVPEPPVQVAEVKPVAPPPPPPPPPPVPVKVAPSTPKAPAPEPVRKKTAPVAPSTPSSVAKSKPAVSTPKPHKPAPQATAPKASPSLRPATALPTQPTKPAPKRVRRKQTAPATAKAVPAPAKAVTRPSRQKLDVLVDPALVEDLDLADLPNQGNSVQVEGEVRNAPFLSASPSRYRLLDYDGTILEMVCHLHGDSTVLRRFVGKGVSIRGREYWVENSDMPVVVVGEIIPLAPETDADKPVLF